MDSGVLGLLAVGEGKGEAGGERGSVQRGESLACSSLFCCCRLAFSIWSWVLVFKS